VYAFAEKAFWERGDWQWAGFARIGRADPDVLAIEYYAGAGLVLNRGETLSVGAALARVVLSAAERRRLTGEAISPDAGETALELTARWQVLDWMALQPAFTHVWSPGADAAIADSSVLGMRLELTW
jgi:carbohydrate-selective porin OprB